LVSPASGALYDHAGPRLLTGLGMMLSLGALALLALTMNGSPQSLMPIMAALAVFGLGQAIAGFTRSKGGRT
jgi:hypothetical protein